MNIAELSTKYHVELCDICVPVLKFFNFSMFSFSKITAAGQLSVLSTNAYFTEYYFANKYYMHDPHIVDLKNMRSGVAVWSYCNDVHYQGILLYEAKRMFHIGNGVSFIKTVAGTGYDIFSFAVAPGNNNLNNYLFNHSNMLSKFIEYFTYAAESLIVEMQTVAIDIALLKGKKFYQQPGITNIVMNRTEKDFSCEEVNSI